MHIVLLSSTLFACLAGLSTDQLADSVAGLLHAWGSLTEIKLLPNACQRAAAQTEPLLGDYSARILMTKLNARERHT